MDALIVWKLWRWKWQSDKRRRKWKSLVKIENENDVIRVWVRKFQPESFRKNLEISSDESRNKVFRICLSLKLSHVHEKLTFSPQKPRRKTAKKKTPEKFSLSPKHFSWRGVSWVRKNFLRHRKNVRSLWKKNCVSHVAFFTLCFSRHLEAHFHGLRWNRTFSAGGGMRTIPRHFPFVIISFDNTFALHLSSRQKKFHISWRFLSLSQQISFTKTFRMKKSL